MDLSFALRRKTKPKAQPIEWHRLLAQVGAHQATTATAIAQARLELAAATSTIVDPRIALFSQNVGETVAAPAAARFAPVDEAAFISGQPN